MGRQKMVRLRRVPPGAGRSPADADLRHDLYLQEVQEGIPEGCEGIRGCVSAGHKATRLHLLMRDSDEYCPHCDNHFVLDAKTPKASIQVEGEDARIDSRYVQGLQGMDLSSHYAG